jgi:uncharacterized membrane protein YdbT with pleckstrin-like domain
MGKRGLRDGESLIIAVNPIVGGLVRPYAVTALLASTIYVAAAHIATVRHHEELIALLFLGPALLLCAYRTWRWRSCKIKLTTECLHLSSGILRKRSQAIQLDDILAVSVKAPLVQRLSRRGRVVVEMTGRSVDIGLVHHPKALVRLIETALSDRSTVQAGHGDSPRSSYEEFLRIPSPLHSFTRQSHRDS